MKCIFAACGNPTLASMNNPAYQQPYQNLAVMGGGPSAMAMYGGDPMTDGMMMDNMGRFGFAYGGGGMPIYGDGFFDPSYNPMIPQGFFPGNDPGMIPGYGYPYGEPGMMDSPYGPDGYGYGYGYPDYGYPSYGNPGYEGIGNGYPSYGDPGFGPPSYGSPAYDPPDYDSY